MVHFKIRYASTLTKNEGKQWYIFHYKLGDVCYMSRGYE